MMLLFHHTQKNPTTFNMPTLYLIPSRKGVRIGDDIYTLLLDGDKVRRIFPEKLKEWTVEAHCGASRTECVACQKYIHDNVKFASDLLYLIYDAKTNTLSHNTNYFPFTGMSYRNNDDEDLIPLPRAFALPLREGMFLSFNLPSNPRRWWYAMEFHVAAFEDEDDEEEAIEVDEEEDEAIVADVDIEVDEIEVDEIEVDEEEEEEDINRSLVLLSHDDDDDDDDGQPPQLIDHNAEDEKEGGSIASVAHTERLVQLARSPLTRFEISMEVDDDEPPQLDNRSIAEEGEFIASPSTSHIERLHQLGRFEINNNMDDDDDEPPPLVSIYRDNEVVYLASDRGPQQTIPFIASVAVQPPLDPRPPPQVPEDARVQTIGTPQRMPDPPGGTPLNFSSPPPTNAVNKNAAPPQSEDGDTDDVAAVLRIELEKTQGQLHASLARNAFLSPFAKGYQSLNSP